MGGLVMGNGVPTATPPPVPALAAKPPPTTQAAQPRFRPRDAGPVDGYAYYGCLVDDSADRVIDGQRIDNTAMQPSLCRDLCANLQYSVFGVEYQTECYCGNSVRTTNVIRVPDADCSMPCLANRAYSCGAWSKVNIYSATAPLSAVGGSITGTQPAAPTGPPGTGASGLASPGCAASLSPGAIAGIVIGAALAVGLACAASFLLGLKMNPRRSRQAAGKP